MDQVAELRRAPVNGRGNRLDVAIRLSRRTQGEIARSLRVRAALISHLKLGRVRNPPSNVADRLAAYFGCEAADLFPPQDAAQRSVPAHGAPRPMHRFPMRGLGGRRLHGRTAPIGPLSWHLEMQRLAIVGMLTDARLARGFTLQEIADRLHRTRQQVKQWESAVHNLRIDSMMEWADVLGFRIRLEPVKPALAR